MTTTDGEILILKLKKMLKNYKADAGSYDYLAGYLDGWNDGEAKQKRIQEGF